MGAARSAPVEDRRTVRRLSFSTSLVATSQMVYKGQAIRKSREQERERERAGASVSMCVCGFAAWDWERPQRRLRRLIGTIEGWWWCTHALGCALSFGRYSLGL